MLQCFGRRKTRNAEREPLLPRYHDDTVLQSRLHEKLHTYQMVRAISKGYLPSNEQLVTNLRALLTSDVLNPDDSSVTDSGRLLAKTVKTLLYQLIELLQHKNSEDQLQDFVWMLIHSRVSVDATNLSRRASSVRSQAKTTAAYQSAKTVGSLLLTNSDFRVFLSDLQTIGREIFRDSALATSKAVGDVAHQVDPAKHVPDGKAVEASDQHGAPSQQDLSNDMKGFTSTVGKGASAVGKEAKDSTEAHFSGIERETFVKRAQNAVSQLRQRPDYSSSVSIITILLKRYVFAYSRAVEEAAVAIEDDVHANEELDLTVKNFWSLLTSFGERKEWDELRKRSSKLAEHYKHDQELEGFVREIGEAIHRMLLDPSFLSEADEKIKELRASTRKSTKSRALGSDLDAVLEQLPKVLKSVAQDVDVSRIISTSLTVLSLVSPADAAVNPELTTDLINIFVPLVIQAVQYIPIPRLEISIPEMDLLLENLVIEPGKTINSTSFLPFRFRVESRNEFEIRKAHTRTISTKTANRFTLKIDGLTLRADDLGFWLRAHSGLFFKFADEGLASFQLDERGVDIHLDVEVGQERLEKVLALKAVRVRVHKLSYILHKSKFSCLSWFFKPLLRPLLRRIMERQIAHSVADFCHAANREIVFARERLRATRVADPADLLTFVRAVAARLKPAEDPDVDVRIGVEQPGKGVFKGVYAPGSVVKLWNEEATRAGERVDDFQRGGWRNHVFDLPSMIGLVDREG